MQISSTIMETGTSGSGGILYTVGGNEKAIQEYVRNQLHEDIASDQMCMREFKDPFTGESVVRGK